MIKPPSIQSEYTLIYSGDPALDLPEEAEARDHALKLARETGNWPIREGEQPTTFVMGQIQRNQRDWILGEMSRRKLCAPEIDALILRVALRSIGNFGTLKVKRSRDAEAGFHLADADVIDTLEAVASNLIPELANAVWERATNPLRPL